MVLLLIFTSGIFFNLPEKVKHMCQEKSFFFKSSEYVVHVKYNYTYGSESEQRVFQIHFI